MENCDNITCHLCNIAIEGDYVFHMITSHLDTFICILSINLPLLTPDEILEYINNYIEMYTDGNNYERLTELCDNIGYLKQGVSNIDNVCEKIIINADEACPICLETISNKESYKIIKCRHIFCKECINTWLKDNVSCPMCKNDLTN
jgi:E3 ubiquitin-protein ligase SHPRH